ncbi:MAG: hypothetical protein QOE12_2077, partial [Mycobacterium sp.]|nr:hypothetical protein [Mycobacterium sp.]
MSNEAIGLTEAELRELADKG